MMPTEKNKALVRRLWEEVWNQNDLAACDEIFNAEYAETEATYRSIAVGNNVAIAYQ